MVLSKTPGWNPSSTAGSQAPRRGPSTPIPNRTPAPTATPQTPFRPRTAAPNRGAPRTFMMKSAINAQASRVDPGGMASAMQNLNISQPMQPPRAPSDCYDPSLGPRPPEDQQQDPWQGSACPTINTNVTTYNIAVNSKTCIRTLRTVDDFKLGQIIALPCHKANLNPNNKVTHPRLKITCEGPVFSKRRLMAVIHKHQNSLFCLEMYTFEGKGVGHKKGTLQFEYVCVMNKGEKKFRNAGKYQPIEVETYDPSKPMKDTSCIQITGGTRVDCAEHISYVGRMDEASFKRLMALYERRNEIAKQQAWEPDEPKPKI